MEHSKKKAKEVSTTDSLTLLFHKRPGETPLQALFRLRKEKPELKDVKLSYAGRLDPLAEGELLVLVGEENKKRHNYLGLDKTYVVDVLFGVSTDTGDVLGTIKDSKEYKNLDTILLQDYVTTFSQQSPKYSSKPGHNKEVSIYDIKKEKEYTITSEDLHAKIIEKINSVSGEFRQEIILEKWEEFFSKNKQKEFKLTRLNVHCSSGTYMRLLAERIGKSIGLPALAFHINRAKIHI